MLTLNKIILRSTVVLLFIFIFTIINIFINKYFFKKPMDEIQNINYVYIDGIRINYVKKGNGAPLLLIHGFIESILVFDKLIEDLSKSNTVLALDLLGFGYSDKHLKFNYSRKSMAETCKKFMLSQGFSNFIILGHSMGGEIALNIAYYNPEVVKKLILVSSTGYNEIVKLPQFIINIKVISKLIIKIIFKTYCFQNIGFRLAFSSIKSFDKGLFNRLYSLMIHIPSETLYRFALQDDSGEIAKKIQFINTDTLIIWGENDNIIPLKYGRLLNRDLKNSKLITLHKCGHIPFVERRNSFTNIIENYISEKSTTSRDILT